MAKSTGVHFSAHHKKHDLIKLLLQTPTTPVEEPAVQNLTSEGVLDIVQDGFGFLRGDRMLASPNDVYVSQSQIRRFMLRTGDKIVGTVRPPKDNERYLSLLRVEQINGMDPDVARKRPSAEQLVPIFPNQQIKLETEPNILSTRLVDLVAPIGRGQRGLIVSPPKAGRRAGSVVRPSVGQRHTATSHAAKPTGRRDAPQLVQPLQQAAMHVHVQHATYGPHELHSTTAVALSGRRDGVV
jgi:transcription termination factor Rho